HFAEALVADRNVEAIAEGPQRVLAHLLLLMGDVLALAGGAHAVALDGLRQDDRRLTGVRHRRGVGGVDLLRIVAAALEAPEVLIGEAGDHRLELRIAVEEVLAHELAAGVRDVGLVVAVDRLFHAPAEDAVTVLGEQRIPVAAPDDFEHVPARAAEVGLELLDDLAVAAHRAVQTLQVTV